MDPRLCHTNWGGSSFLAGFSNTCQHGAGGIVGDSGGGGGGGIVGDSGGGGGAYVLILHEPINVQMRSSSHVATATS